MNVHLTQALHLATQARLLCPPNPAVGCVLAAADGTVLGQGHTQRTGEAHAEVMALRDAAARGHDVRGATAYVTLEPCAHHGRTGPCCDALIAAGVAKVVALQTDPNPRVAGQGFARLRAAGIAVEVLPAEHPLVQQARELNLGFFSRMVRGTPWVRLKVAASLDGQTALNNGTSQWITSPEARADGHAWRARACAVLTGIGTVRADNPRLDVREVDTPRQPSVVVVDSRLETPLDAHILIAARACLIYTAAQNDAKKAALEARGATVIHCPGPDGRVDLTALLRDLGQREINEVHVEAGHTLNGALLAAGCVDELLIYLAPKLLGPGRGMFALPALTQLSQAQTFDFTDLTQIGPDMRLRARIAGRAPF